MSNELNLKDDFKLVTYKNKGRNQKKTLELKSKIDKDFAPVDPDLIKRRIFEAKDDLCSSDLYDSFRASMREGLDCLGNKTVEEIVCFGLGRFSECVISRYQLALLLSFKETYSCKVYVYDPIFSKNEIDLLLKLDFEVLNENTEGKFKVKGEGLSLFYLPHCPKELSNNLVWSNWGLNLSACIIISNSFNGIIERNNAKDLENKAGFICKILPYTLELAVINSFKYFEVFNDTAIHIFPINNLKLISNDFWVISEKEPEYNSNDLEFITKNLY
nr:SRR1-like protein isoform X1 [Onthophagus taurus]